MNPCGRCPLSMVCLAFGIHHSKLLHEHCTTCKKYWMRYYNNDAVWETYEAPGPMCMEPKKITCDRCLSKGAKWYFPPEPRGSGASMHDHFVSVRPPSAQPDLPLERSSYGGKKRVG